MRRTTLVAIADPMRFRRPLPWIMMAIALLLVCGIIENRQWEPRRHQAN